MSPLLHRVGNLVTVSADKVEVLNAFFVLVFINKVSHAFLCLETGFKEETNCQ